MENSYLNRVEKRANTTLRQVEFFLLGKGQGKNEKPKTRKKAPFGEIKLICPWSGGQVAS